VSRVRLPNRRSCVTTDVDVGTVRYTASVGFDADGAPREIFLSSGKPGSHMDALLGDVGIALSIALQSGVRASTMCVSISRTGNPPAQPVSAVGSALELLAAYEQELAADA
jgi:hypothetical protein